MKSEISDSTRGGKESRRAYKGCTTVSLGLALGLGLAHLFELGPFGENFRPALVGHDEGVRSSDRSLVGSAQPCYLLARKASSFKT